MRSALAGADAAGRSIRSLRPRRTGVWREPLAAGVATGSVMAKWPPAAPDLQILRAAKARSRVVKKNAGASLVDLGDGVLCVSSTPR